MHNVLCDPAFATIHCVRYGVFPTNIYTRS